MQQSPEEVVAQHTGLVKHVVARVCRKTGYDDREDELLQYGIKGLLEAARRYDPTRGTTFSTFAWYRIYGEVYNGIKTIAPESYRQNFDARFGETTNEYLEQTTVRLQQSNITGVNDPIHEMEQILDSTTTIYLLSLEAIQDNLPDEESLTPEEALQDDELRDYLRATIESLPPKERNVVELHYYKNLSYRQIGELIGASKAWVCRIHRRAIKIVQRRLTAILRHGDP